MLAVAETGSIRSAAAALNRTQPAVTQAIRRLEQATGLELMDRSSYRARLTPHGERFTDRARLIVKEVQGLQDLAALLLTGVEPRIRIALDCAIPQSIWLELSRLIARQSPITQVEIEAGEGHSMRPRLINGDIDLAILFDQTLLNHNAEIETVPLGHSSFACVCRTDQLDLIDSAPNRFPQILVFDPGDPGQTFGKVDGLHHWRVSDHRMQIAMILDGLGWGSVPVDMVAEALAEGTLAATERFGMKKESRHAFSLCRRQGNMTGQVGRMLWDAAADLRLD